MSQNLVLNLFKTILEIAAPKLKFNLYFQNFLVPFIYYSF